MSLVLSVNVARESVLLPGATSPTGIAKTPTADLIAIRDPGPKRGGLGSGLVDDVICSRRDHGGSDQAVYAYARESLDFFAAQLGRELPAGGFGENLTTRGVDVDAALLGERWHIGSSVVLQVTAPRIPCATFRTWIGAPGWLKQFTEAARPGAYLRVLNAGAVAAGDRITIERPDHDVTIALSFQALLRRPDLLPRLLSARDYLTDELREIVASGRTFSLDP